MRLVSQVLMLSYPFPPAASGGVFRILRFAKYLPKCGWEPIIVTPRPKSVVPISIDKSLDRLIPDGLHVERTRVLRPVVAAKGMFKSVAGVMHHQKSVQPECDTSSANNAGDPSRSPQQESTLWRWVRPMEQLLAMPDRHVGWFLPAVFRGLRLVRRHRPKVLYSTGPPHSTHLIAVALKKLTGLPIVLDFRDPWAAREWGAQSRRSFRSRMTSRIEKFCVNSADQVVLNTPALRDLFLEEYGATNAEKFCAIPNGFDPSFVDQVDELVGRYGPDGVNGSVKLCHAGSAWGKRDLRPLAEAVKIVAGNGHLVEMEQVGSVSPNLRFPEGLEENGSASAITFLGELPHDQALERMARANILVLIQPENTLQVPGKLYEMLPFRKPILALTGRGATADVVERYRLGLVADANDPTTIASAISRLADDIAASRNPSRFDDAMRAFDGRALTERLAETLVAAVAR